MPWENRSVSQMREEFVKRVQAEEKSKSALCREYEISRPTGDKWIKRYMEFESLCDESRRPHNIANRTPTETEEVIVEYRKAHPAIGAVKIHRILKNKGYDLPSAKTVNNILKRNGLITRQASQNATPCQRYEKQTPNEMWQADYKGHFEMRNGQRCHPLNIVDDCSRFSVCCKTQSSETYEEIRPAMIEVFEEYGLPFSFLCDNGNPWGTVQSTGFTQFEVWMMEHGILVIHGRIKHPQTQGKDERFNRSMKKELLKGTQIADEADAQRQFDEYRSFYNNERPHHALNLDTPSEHYTRSTREYSENVREWEYPSGSEVRRVKESGYVTYNGQGYFLSEGFRGKEIAIRPSSVQGCISLFFRQFRIGRIDVDKRVFTFKKAYLIDGDPRLRSISDEAKDPKLD